MADKDHDPVYHPAHYQSDSGLEAIEVIDAFFSENYYLGNAFKYLARAGRKGEAREDLEKAIWYIEHSLSRMPEREYVPVPEGASLQVTADGRVVRAAPHFWVEDTVD